MNQSLVWFRDDLRVADNPALLAACSNGNAQAIYILDEESAGIRPLGGAAKWWLHHSLASLRSELSGLGVPLIFRCGPAVAVLEEIQREHNFTAVFWNRRYGGPERAVDTAIKSQLSANGVEVESFQASLLHEPWQLRTGAGNPYQVFTPFWKALSQTDFRSALARPSRMVENNCELVASVELQELNLLPQNPDWSDGLQDAWEVSEEAALRALADFVDGPISHYQEDRDRPDVKGTSRLSPYLRWGQISPFQVFDSLRGRHEQGAGNNKTDDGGGAAVYASELGWREFCWHQLYHHPDLAQQNLRRQYDAYPWWEPSIGLPEEPYASNLVAWQKGETGIPLVDAGLRELWSTGFMHNRVRMVAASLLVKNLAIHWRLGEAWFWDTLVDADAASNPANWQWVAGSGADASPFFRIFNPETQAKKFDPLSSYITKWVPEILLPDYPEPIVDLKESRKLALDGLEFVKAANAASNLNK